MTSGQADEIVTFRLGPRDRAAIQRLVDEGEFRNRSDFLRYAVKSALRDLQSESATPRVAPDLELEGYELPTPEPEARRNASPRARREVRQND